MEDFSNVILKMVLAGVIEQAWDDATNFKTYKNDYITNETKENRESATAWFAGKEFEMMCDIVGVDIKCIREELERIQKNKMDKIKFRNLN